MVLPVGDALVDALVGPGHVVDQAFAGFSRAIRRTRALTFRRVAGRPVLPRMDRAAQRRRTMSRCQRRTVSGVTSNRS
jgi:hypothetical protein